VFPTGFRVVVDACALYPFNVRDALLRAAESGLYQLYWSAEILDEVVRNLVGNGVMDEPKASRLRRAMEESFPESLVVDYDELIPAMRNDVDDRHVAAAAVKAGAQVIVTYNVRDFSDLPDGIEAQSPDDFLSALFDLDPAFFVEILRRQAADRTRPAMTLDDMLEAMTTSLHELVAAVRAHLG
jgi:predicted nucleic acid-binding protein